MKTAVVNVKVDPSVKKEAQKVAKELGLSLSGIINGFLKQFVRTKIVHFSLSEEPSEYLLQALTESEEDVKKGRVSPTFDNADEAIDWLKNPKKKYAG